MSEATHPGGTVEIVRERAQAHALVAPLELRVLSGPMAKHVFRATRERFVIGVHPSADFVLKDETVSQFQCEVTIEGDRIAIRDLGSKNGTLVDGVSVVHAFLRIGSRIRIGSTEIELGLGDSPVEVPLTAENRVGELERFLALGGILEPSRNLSQLDLTNEDLKTARERWVRTFEREYLVQLLEANDGNASAAARSAGVDRKYLYRLLWRHGLR